MHVACGSPLKSDHVGQTAVSAGAVPEEVRPSIERGPTSEPGHRQRLPNGLLPGMMPRRLGISRGESKVTPTCRSPKLSYFGGPIVQSPIIVPVSWSSDVQQEVQTNMPQFYADVMASSYWEWLVEYDTVGISGGTNQAILPGTVAPAVVLKPSICPSGSGSPSRPCTVQDTDIQNELTAQIGAQKLPAPSLDCTYNAESIYMIEFPPNVEVIGPDGVGTSCADFCAYHNTGAYGSNNVPLIYGVLMDQYTSACDTGCGGNPTSLENTTDTASHELLESVTDPDIGLDLQANYANPAGWGDNNNSCGEIADICDNSGAGDSITVSGRSWIVQELWSNKQNKCASTGTVPSVCAGTITTGCRLCSCGDTGLACSGETPVCETSSTNVLFGGCEQCSATDNVCATGSRCVQNAVAAQDDLCIGVTITPAQATVAQGNGYTGFSASNAVGAVSWTVAPAGAGVQINPSSGAITTATTAVVGQYTVTAKDTANDTGTATLNVNAALKLSPAAPVVAVGDQVAFAASGGVAPLNWSVVSSSGGTLQPGGCSGLISCTYTAGMTSGQTDSVTVTDALNNVATAVVMINPALKVSPSSVTIAQGDVYNGFATSGGVGSVTWAITVAAGLSVDGSGVVTAEAGTPTGTYVVTATDSLQNSATAMLQVNAPLALSPQTFSLGAGERLTFMASQGTGGYAWSLAGGSGGSLAGCTAGSGTCQYTAGPTAATQDTVTVMDSFGNMQAATVSVGTALAISPASATVLAGQGRSFTASGGSGTYDWSLTSSSGASLAPSCTHSSTCAYTAGSPGGAQDTILVTDADNGAVSAVVTVDPDIVIAVSNDTTPPTVNAGDQVQFSATGGSGGGYTWTFAASDATPAGTLTSDGQYTAADSPGTDTVEVMDSAGNTATVVITVTPHADAGPPRVDAGSAGMDAGSAVSDAGGASVDAGSSAADAGQTAIDAGTSNGDAGSVTHTDAGAGGLDGGTVVEGDAGPIAHDAGTASEDAGEVTPTDAGRSTADAGPDERDGGLMTDGGSSATPDAGASTDAGMTGTDAGNVFPDGGSAKPDAGSPSLGGGGCSCGSGGDSVSMAALMAAFAALRRRRRSRVSQS